MHHFHFMKGNRIQFPHATETLICAAFDKTLPKPKVPPLIDLVTVDKSQIPAAPKSDFEKVGG